MMNKSIFALFGSAATLFAFNANAADVVMPAPTPMIMAEEAPTVGYVAVCDMMDNGYFYIPGSETCLRLSGAVSATMGYDDRSDQYFTGTELRFDVDTAADSEIGLIKTKVRFAIDENYDSYYFGGTPARTSDIELAYITAGPMFVGYKETMFNTNLGYSDFELINAGLSLNSNTVGFMANNAFGDVYLGAAIESDRRGSLSASNGIYANNYTPDFVGRVGVGNQPWGSLDVSGIYMDNQDSWMVKTTADLTPMEALNLRMSATYLDDNSSTGYILAAAAMYDFTDTLSGFTGVSYFDQQSAAETIEANLGATWTPASNLDVTGQLTYIDQSNNDNINTKLIITRSF